MNVIGISALYHDAACCIIKDGVLVAAVQEERFSRIKNDPSIPVNGFRFCLKEAQLSINDVDIIAYYEKPELKLARQLWSKVSIGSHRELERLDPTRPEKQIRDILGYDGSIEFVEHHLSHAASAFYFSGRRSAAILTVDGVGEWATTTYSHGVENNIKILETVNFPDSIGLLYATITAYLGFGVNSGEYKVMGLAPYGHPLYVDRLKQLISEKAGGQFELNMQFFDFVQGNRMFSDHLIALLGQPPRSKNEDVNQFHKDVARSMQVVLNEILLSKCNYLYNLTGEKDLCMAGGVALNCVANSEILNNGPFKNVFIQPAAGDAGCALGAAMVAYHRYNQCEIENRQPLKHVFLGPGFLPDDLLTLLESSAFIYRDYRKNADTLIGEVVSYITNGKVIGWFQGRMEFGPRSLGNRSILADPRNASMRERINAMVKKREQFRPFAPVILEHKMKEHFQMQTASPFMLFTFQVNSPLDMPATTHVDNSARVQTVNEDSNPKLTKLLEKFDEREGCPVLLNTSFNVKDEPIVCTPEEAIICFANSDIDVLVLGDFILDRQENLMLLARISSQSMKHGTRSFKDMDTYTFI